MTARRRGHTRYLTPNPYREERMMPIADHDGVVEIDGSPHWIREGDEYPDGATFREAEQPVARPYVEPHDEPPPTRRPGEGAE